MAYPSVTSTNPGPNTSSQPAQIAPLSVTTDQLGAPTGLIYANNQSLGVTGAQLAGIGSSLYVKPSGDTTGLTDFNSLTAANVAINAAGGGTVFLLPGTYWLNASVQFLNNVRFVGAGIGITTVKLANSIPYARYCSLFKAYANAADIFNFGLRDMTLDWNGANQSFAVYGGAIGSITPAISYVIGAGNAALSFKIDAGSVLTANIAQATYTTLTALLAAIQAAIDAAFGAGLATVIASNTGVLAIYSTAAGGPATGISSLGGTAAAGLFGTPTYTVGVTDNEGNCVTVRGNTSTSFAHDFTFENLECKNAAFHGIACYESVYAFSITGCRLHDNGFRGVHVHGNGLALTADSRRFIVSNNRVYNNGQGLGNASNTGIFVVYLNAHEILVTNNIVYNEPGPGIALFGDGAGAIVEVEGAVCANNSVYNCGDGIVLSTIGSNFSGLVVGNNNVVNAGNNLLIGSAVPSTLVITGSNGSIDVTACGVTKTVTAAPATYGSNALLAAELASKANAAFAAYPVTFAVTALATAPVGYLYMVPTFGTLSATLFSVAATAGNTGFAVMFGSTPTQYGGRCWTGVSGIGVLLSCAAAYGLRNSTITGNSIRGCSGYGLRVTSSGATFKDISITGNSICDNATDLSQGAGGLKLNTASANFCITGNVIARNGAIGANDINVYLAGTQHVFTGNIVDAGLGVTGAALAVSVPATYSIVTGNVISRAAGGANALSDTGTGNIISNNVLGTSGGDIFLPAAAGFSTTSGYGTTGAQTALLGANAPAALTILTAPYTWTKELSADGTTVWSPKWK